MKRRQLAAIALSAILSFSACIPATGFSVYAAENDTTPEFAALIDETFGSLEELIQQLTALATGQFGSGWAWLNAGKDGKLSVSNSPNQDNPISEGKGCVPILAVDVWEHAYYLKYKNLRPDYIKALFTIINWEAVEANYKRVAGK